MVTVRLLMKDYEYLADRLVPMGEQCSMSKADIVQMLRGKTKKFTEENILELFGKKA